MYLAWKDDKIFNKFLFILLITFMIILISISPCFAENEKTIEITPSREGGTTSVILPSFCGTDYDYYLISAQNFYDSSFKRYTLRIGIIVSNSPLYANNSNIITNKDGSVFYYNFFEYNYKTSMSSSYDLSSVLLSDFSACYVSLNSTVFKSDYFVYSNHTIYSDTTENTIVFEGTFDFINPSFMTTQEELSSGKFDTLKIDAGSFDTLTDSFIFNIYDSYNMGDGVYSDYIKKSFLLDMDSSFLKVADLNAYYYIPQSSLGIDLSNGKRYTFELKAKGPDEIYSSVTFQVGGLTIDEELKNKEDEQTDAIRENTETNKGIWETIKDIVSFINPFSENFFVYKLIDLLVDALKSLFIPSDGFFDTYFTELKDWFSERLGFLFYPFELLIDILNKILNVNFSEPIFNIPDISEPFTNKKFINATTFNFNDLLSNSILNTVHNIYFICVDAFIVFELVNLFRRKYEEVTTK